ncbi:MAG: hypothetical protein J6R18_04970 [Kiritimatiellae bacterium]|nr:hypothetical protein [Kiritimatiellia bacterium]
MNMNIVPTWSDFRAKQAVSVINARQDAFKMNEFGNVGVVDYDTLVKHDASITADDMHNLLYSKAVGVREPNGVRETKKPYTHVLGKFESFCAKVATFFNFPSKARANRIQNDMEYHFGCAIGHIVNTKHLLSSDKGNSQMSLTKQKVFESLKEFFAQTDYFVEKFKLDKVDAHAAEKCEKQVVSRLVNSLANSLRNVEDPKSGDKESLSSILDVANRFGMPANPTDLDRRINRVMGELKAQIAPRLKELTDVKEAAPPKPNTGIAATIEKWKNSFKFVIAEKTKQLAAYCEKLGPEMETAKEAFNKIAQDLDESTRKDINVDSFISLVRDMNDKIGAAIVKGKELIEARYRKEVGELGKATYYKLRSGSGDIKMLDLSTNKEVFRELMVSTSKTSKEVQAKGVSKTPRFAELQEQRNREAAEILGKEMEEKSLSLKNINMMNDVIKAFSSAKDELYHKVCPELIRLSLKDLLTRKSENPPMDGGKAVVDAAVWKKACDSVSALLSGKLTLGLDQMSFGKEMMDEVGLVLQYKDHFSEGMDDAAKKRLEHVFDYLQYQKGFGYEDSVLSIESNSQSFDACRIETRDCCKELFGNIESLKEAYKPDEDDGTFKTDTVEKTANTIKSKISELIANEFGDSIVNFSSAKVKTDVDDSVTANRQNGVFLERDGDDGKLRWIENKDIEELAKKTAQLITRVNRIIRQESASALSSLNLSDVKAEEAFCAKRLGLIEKSQELLEPLVKVYLESRSIVATNALARIRDDIKTMRVDNPATADEIRLNELCDAAEKEISEITIGEVGKAVKVLKQLHEGIGDAQVKIDKKNFAGNIERLSSYGADEIGIGSVFTGKAYVDMNIGHIDSLTVAFRRTRDMGDLVSDSFQSFRNVVTAVVKKIKSDKLDRGLLNKIDFSIDADRARRSFSDYTKSMMEYGRILREEPTDQTKRTNAADAVRQSLSVFCSSLSPTMELLTNVEILVREQFAAYHEKKAALVDEYHDALLEAGKKNKSTGMEAPSSLKLANAIKPEITPAAKLPELEEEAFKARFHNLKEEFPLCFDNNFAKTFTEMRRAIHNAFIAIGEISRGAVTGVQSFIEKDNLKIVDDICQTQNGMQNVKAEYDTAERRGKLRHGDVFKAVQKGGPFDTASEFFDTETKLFADAKSYYGSEYDRYEAEMTTLALRQGEVLTDTIFSAMDKTFLSISTAKMNGQLPGNVAKAISDLISKRTRIVDVDALKECLVMNKVSQEDVDKLCKSDGILGSFSEITQNLISLTSKYEACEIREYGTGEAEKHAVVLNNYLATDGTHNVGLLSTDNIKAYDYNITGVETVEGAITRVSVKNSEGYESYYTMQYDQKEKVVKFTPEGAGTQPVKGRHFYEFSVKASVTKLFSSETVAAFPFHIQSDNQIYVRAPVE